MKFGQAILIRVLKLNIETSYTNRPLHNEHENVIFAKKSFIEKSYKQVLSKIKIQAARIFYIFNHFLSFRFFMYS